MDSSFTYPKLRWPIEIRFEKIDSDELLLLQCPLGVTQDPLVLVAAVAPVVTALDGSRSFQQILDSFSEAGLSAELLEQLLQILDQSFFLANDRFFAAEKAVKENFSQLDVRPAFLAGRSYPIDPVALAQLVDSYCLNGVSLTPVCSTRILGIVAPHIDYRRGGESYGKIYPHLATVEADLYILIGTCHQYSRTLFQLTRKNFSSPLGTLRTDRIFVDTVAQSYGVKRAYADEYLHRKEHSLELQLPFFSRIRPAATIVPILVGSFHEMIEADRFPHEWEEYETFVSAITSEIGKIESKNRRVCFIAGVDMAHVGRAFGDEGSLTPERMREIANLDSEYLAAMCSGDKTAFFQHVASDRDARRICGFPTMYTVLDILSRLGYRCCGEVVDYSQAVDYTSDCGVTFAGVEIRDTSTISVL